MRSLKTLTTIYFGTRYLRKVNKLFGVHLRMDDVKIMYFIYYKESVNKSKLAYLSKNEFLETRNFPRLLDAGYLQIIDKRYEITPDGISYLKRFADMLNKGRMDKIATSNKPEKRLYRGTSG